VSIVLEVLREEISVADYMAKVANSLLAVWLSSMDIRDNKDAVKVVLDPFASP